MRKVLSFITNRNVILILAVILGLWIGDYAIHLKKHTTYILALVMTFSMTNIRTQSLYPFNKLLFPMLKGALLNYILYAAIMLASARLLISDEELFYGFVIIATTAPGVAIIPFSSILKGDIEYSIKGVLGAFIFTIILTPFVVGYLTGNNEISSSKLFLLMVKTIIIPLALSRILLIGKIRNPVNEVRGKVVDWGFAILIFIAIGVNRAVFFHQSNMLIGISAVLLISHFITGILHENLFNRISKNKAIITSDNLLITVKSSGFAVVTALELFGQKAAIPTAVLPIFVLFYLLYLSFRKGS
ncbi:hypothetical protein [Carboxylicivirga caseinilyticus]|uniref:hypothetical protein n=1 Tax=Carboxylicivirga caseinilyticus TaxID=3417572 RepID=UPI003D3458F9|nr:hypothetical protein [Marinilabiliaceae bacterium A049]